MKGLRNTRLISRVEDKHAIALSTAHPRVVEFIYMAFQVNVCHLGVVYTKESTQLKLPRRKNYGVAATSMPATTTPTIKFIVNTIQYAETWKIKMLDTLTREATHFYL